MHWAVGVGLLTVGCGVSPSPILEVPAAPLAPIPVPEKDNTVSEKDDISAVSVAASVLCNGLCGTVLILSDPLEHFAHTSIVPGEFAVIRFDPADLGDAAAGVVAHEWGHLLFMAWEQGPREGHEAELGADRWAGCVLQIAHVDVLPYIVLLYQGEPRLETDSHPAGKIRADAVKLGAELCSPPRCQYEAW